MAFGGGMGSSQQFKPAPPTVNSLHDGVPRRVGIFWDFENVKLEDGWSGPRTVNRIRDTVLAKLPPGSKIDEMRLYFDTEKAEQNALAKADVCMGHSDNHPLSFKAGMDLSGFTMVDCPTRNTKETLDKKIIVDCMGFGMKPSDMPATVVLISGDGDYSYMLSVLRNRRVTSLVIHRDIKVTARILTESCDMSLHWAFDVLGPTQVRKIGPVPRLKTAAAAAAAAGSAAAVAPTAATHKSWVSVTATQGGAPTTSTAAAAAPAPKPTISKTSSTLDRARPPSLLVPNSDGGFDFAASMAEEGTSEEFCMFGRAGYAALHDVPIEEVTDEVVERTRSKHRGYATYFLHSPSPGIIDAAIPAMDPLDAESPLVIQINKALAADHEDARVDLFSKIVRNDLSTVDTILALAADAHKGGTDLIHGANLAEAYYKKVGVKDKARYKAVVAGAIEAKLLAKEWIKSAKSALASPLPHFRLTDAGWARVGTA
mmetsp:Transcript_16995/g.44287  ORF Transcript_16995/g.44287 Transcript_16995/m.44287 type:complete len:485 (+) Transcript_16995:62-1516(+)